VRAFAAAAMLLLLLMANFQKIASPALFAFWFDTSFDLHKGSSYQNLYRIKSTLRNRKNRNSLAVCASFLADAKAVKGQTEQG